MIQNIDPILSGKLATARNRNTSKKMLEYLLLDASPVVQMYARRNLRSRRWKIWKWLFPVVVLSMAFSTSYAQVSSPNYWKLFTTGSTTFLQPLNPNWKIFASSSAPAPDINFRNNPDGLWNLTNWRSAITTNIINPLKNVINGIAGLDGNGKISTSTIPLSSQPNNAITINNDGLYAPFSSSGGGSTSTIKVNNATITNPNFLDNPQELGINFVASGSNIVSFVRDTDVSIVADREIANTIGSAGFRTQLSNGESINTVIINQVVGNPVQMTIYTASQSGPILARLNDLGVNALTISNQQQGNNTIQVQSYSALVFQIVATFSPTTTIAQVRAVFQGLRSDSVYYGGPNTGYFIFDVLPRAEIIRLASSTFVIPTTTNNILFASTTRVLRSTVNGIVSTTSIDITSSVASTTNLLTSNNNIINSNVNSVISTTTIINNLSYSFSSTTRLFTGNTNGVIATTTIDISSGISTTTNILSKPASNTLSSNVNNIISTTSIIQGFSATTSNGILSVGLNGLIATTTITATGTAITDYTRDNLYDYQKDVISGTLGNYNYCIGSRGEKTLCSGGFPIDVDNIITPTLPPFGSPEQTTGGGVYTSQSGNQMWVWKSNGSSLSTLYYNTPAAPNTFTAINSIANLLSASVNGNRSITIGGVSGSGSYQTQIGFVAAVYTQTTSFTSAGYNLSVFNDGSYVAISANGLKIAVVGQRLVNDPIPVNVLQVYNVTYPQSGGMSVTLTFDREWVFGTSGIPYFLDAITFGTDASNLIFGTDGGGNLWTLNYTTNAVNKIKDGFIDDQFTGQGYTFANSNGGWIIFGGDDGLVNVYNQNNNTYPYDVGIPIGLVDVVYAVGISPTGEPTTIGSNNSGTITYRQTAGFLEQNRLYSPLELNGQPITLRNSTGLVGQSLTSNGTNTIWAFPSVTISTKKFKLNADQTGSTNLVFTPTPVISVGSLPVTTSAGTFTFAQAGIYQIVLAFNVSGDPDLWGTIPSDTARYLQLAGAGLAKGSVTDTIQIVTANTTMTFRPNNNVTFYGSIGTATFLTIEKLQ